MLHRYLIVWLVLLSAVAWWWPGRGLPDPFAATKPLVPHLIAVTMYAIGGLLPRDEIRQVLRRWPEVLGGSAVQYTVMPAAAWLLGHAAGLEGDLLLGVILVGCVPGAMASNVLTLTAGGNVSYSVSLTTTATLLSPLVVPLALYLTLRQSSVNAAELAERAFTELTLQVALPVLAGHGLSQRFERVERLMRLLGPPVAQLTILWIIAVVVNANHDRMGQAGGVLLAALLGINLLGYAAGHTGGRLLRLPESGRRALTLEIGMQNAGLGAMLAGQLFPDNALVALPAALYTFGCMLTGTALAQAWSRSNLSR